MGSTDTANANARTTITIMEGDMNWEELYKELTPDIPFDKAKTVRQALGEINKDKKQNEKLTENHVRETLERMHANEGWGKGKFKGVNYYWPPE